MNIIQLVGEIALFYLLPSVIGLFLGRKWNLKYVEDYNKFPPIMAIIPAVNIFAVSCLIIVIIWNTNFVQNFWDNYLSDIYDYFKGE